MATEEVGVVELRVRGNEVCLSHPRRSKAMCRGCFRPSRKFVQRLPPHFAATYREHQMDVGVWCVEKGRDNALGEWPGAGLPWFKKQIGAHMSASSALLVSTP